ncbi:flagellar export protein FliJ [Paucimonas lemoignei]|uniref:Flagellar export protein FliJ n=1 Tax=Paucimonas lemoignei TaxID=29443 RepID=A0A4R3HZM4_PAULE|nr:hypothetical protein [Paucimonas lemoignei]TCS37725.1 flagellar export protein FliJ [Paucimonas lemoignei]
MKNFRYPLDRLKQVRELELATAVDELRQVAATVQRVQNDLQSKQTAIQKAQTVLVETESKSGTVRPDLRKMTALYVQTVQAERDKIEAVLHELEQQQKEAHDRLIEKKQSVKMLEKHEDRLKSSFRLAMQGIQQKEDDELWLVRQKNS